MEISVIVPTCQPTVELFEKTLFSLNNQVGFSKEDYEIVVVENPTDTLNVSALCDKYNARHLVCTEIGANNARNFGVLNSKGKILALTDDDCIPHKMWLCNILTLHNLHPYIGAVGGKVSLSFRGERPPWLVGKFQQWLSEVDWSENIFRIDLQTNVYLVSANLSFTRKIFDETKGFNSNLGYVGDKLRPNDEIDFLKECSKSGLLYVPMIEVAHQIPSSRCNMKFFKHRCFGQGEADAQMYQQQNPNYTSEDIYNNYFVGMWHHIFQYHEITKIREKICNEEMTRRYIKNLMICYTEYFKGVNSILEGNIDEDGVNLPRTNW